MTQISPFKVTQLENKYLRAENEKLVLQLRQMQTDLQQTALAHEQARIMIGALIQHAGGALVIPRAFLDTFFAEANKYGVRQVPSGDVVTLTVELRPVAPPAEAPEAPTPPVEGVPAVARLALAP